MLLQKIKSEKVKKVTIPMMERFGILLFVDIS